MIIKKALIKLDSVALDSARNEYKMEECEKAVSWSDLDIDKHIADNLMLLTKSLFTTSREQEKKKAIMERRNRVVRKVKEHVKEYKIPPSRINFLEITPYLVDLFGRSY